MTTEVVCAENAHQGDPCIHCGVPKDEVPPGPCMGRPDVIIEAYGGVWTARRPCTLKPFGQGRTKASACQDLYRQERGKIAAPSRQQSPKTLMATKQHRYPDQRGGVKNGNA